MDAAVVVVEEAVAAEGGREGAGGTGDNEDLCLLGVRKLALMGESRGIIMEEDEKEPRRLVSSSPVRCPF